MRTPLKHYAAILSHYLKPQRRRVIGLAIALLGSIGLQILNPQILGYFIDTAVSGGSQQQLFRAAFLFIGLAILTQALIVVVTYLGETVAWIATNNLRFDLAKHCLQLDLSFHKSHSPGELLERVDGDVSVLSRFFSQLVIHILGNGILLSGILLVLMLENKVAGISLTIFSIGALFLLLNLQPLAVQPWGAYRQVGAEFFGFLGEHLTGREDIRANGAVGYVMHRFHGILQRWLPIYQKARFASTMLWATSVGLFTIGNAIALAVAAYLWRQNAITIGTAYLIFHYTNLLAQPIERIREELEQFQQVEASIHRIQSLLHVTSPIHDQGTAKLPNTAFPVSFRQVYFRYARENESSPTNWTLKDLSLHLPAGKTLGIVGRTGSGKSTIARLLLRFYDIQSGEIRLGNEAIAHIPLSHLRQRIGLVTQDVQLFQATVRDNLTFFDSRIPDSQILAALETLGLFDWLRSLPHGLDTLLGSDSSGLSAGQAQLLAFARVFLKNPGLVILDEASSRLDPTTEAQLEQAIALLLHQRTAIIIAHRLATLERVDQILMLEQGQMVEYGDRQTLLHLPNSRFAQLLKAGTTITSSL
ncbi:MULTISPECIES: ABC transporter ATP-binding protein [unclassified Leptolyngbya]|uniref:ABC transporter ATP-binding protein n=1 Tax=unclassified Leptolyngbya TaxID=2650499 RepID=UPI0016878301|nr:MULTISPECIES: ABC transporter ATP-binding protein [unclassified Leptolyngbya]MBD1913197.1 ABC transporter ATP-binding protein [Leptolyngbya sp. FACHB-8]MBD2154919.1 ABC transporter ATP-binding protein [Leptolyngbya sp. FACHB-16]